MSGQIIGLHDWFETPPGRYLLAWEQAAFDTAVADVFGYHALQMGVPELDGLRACRIQRQWLAMDAPPGPRAPRRAALVNDFAALPFEANSLDLVLLPHALELSPDPHATLREVERVLMPEGQAVVCGFNAASLWGLRQRRARAIRRFGLGQLYLPAEGDFIGYWRLRDWLRLLSFEVESSRFGCYRPAVRSESMLGRFGWMDTLGARCWPILGAVYFVVAVKRVRGMRLLEASWKSRRALANAPVPVANRHRPQPRPVAEPACTAPVPPVTRRGMR
ncbi:class I SAM-dependent methyltransferase [Pseudorhodoferax sp.]|uniref:class I SAM-dependent methyltransferase n=1 Tax=Pseudorhodoferax sp. TaxID=1993553 RepID=UPI0039E2AD5B